MRLSKACGKCGEEKPFFFFAKSPSRAGGLHSYCTPCNSAVAQAWKEQNRLRAREMNAASKSKHQRTATEAQLRRLRRIAKATPPWFKGQEAAYLAKVAAIRDFLTERTGVAHEIDHLHAISGPNFCGLHVPANIRVAPASVNLRKGNRLPAEHQQLAW